MQNFSQIIPLQQQLALWRQTGERIALVPTMGNLHAGHLSLVEKAKSVSDKTVVTIFVNPAQFVEGEDYISYPRTLEEDMKLLMNAGVDVVFHPDVNEIYPDGTAAHTLVSFPALDNIYCGKFRPGHFAGVATVVTKLLNISQPDVAVFGEKDYQQLLVIKQLVKDLCMPVSVIGVPTLREPDGLAMSSRNTYLSPEQRQQATVIFQVLNDAAEKIRRGDRNYAGIEQRACTILEQAGFSVDYVAVCDAKTLEQPGQGDPVVLVAARLGKARLIDNIIIRR